jgi:hypothetical protein
LALREDGTTLRNIVERATVTVLLVEPEQCCSIKGRGTAGETTIPPDPVMPFTARRADIRVEEVLLDAEPGATIESGPRYRREAPREAELDYCRRVHAALRGP